MGNYPEKVLNLFIDFAPKVFGAVIILIVGLFIIRLLVKTLNTLLRKQKLEVTLQKFISDLTNWILRILLFVILASKLGIETTTFAAIIGAAGLAVGLALQGSLANFAGGTLLLVFKPFKIGDLIEVQGITGVVKEIQIFTTHIKTPENKLAILPNGLLSNGSIMNYSVEGQLRIDLTFGVSYDADIHLTKKVLMNVLNSNQKILTNPAPTVNVSELADSSVNFAVRPWVNTENYWDVYFETTEMVKLALDSAGIEIPYPHSVEIQK